MDLPDVQLDEEACLRFLYACRLPSDKLTMALPDDVPPASEPAENVQTNAALTSQGHAKMFVDAIEAIQSGPQTRQARRLATALKGHYQRETPDMQAGELLIEDLSQGGVKLRTQKAHQIKLNEVLRLQFSLCDDASRSVAIYIQVLWIEGQTIGGRFQRPEALPEALVAFLQSS